MGTHEAFPDLTPRPPSLRGKGERALKEKLPFPFRGGDGGEGLRKSSQKLRENYLLGFLWRVSYVR